MKAYEYILSKQTQWALNHGIPLIRSKEGEGRGRLSKDYEALCETGQTLVLIAMIHLMSKRLASC